MAIVLQVTAPERHPYVGQYLKDFDPNGAEGRGTVTVTPEIRRAKSFPAAQPAMDWYMTKAANGYPAMRWFAVRVVELERG